MNSWDLKYIKIITAYVCSDLMTNFKLDKLEYKLYSAAYK